MEVLGNNRSQATKSTRKKERKKEEERRWLGVRVTRLINLPLHHGDAIGARSPSASSDKYGPLLHNFVLFEFPPSIFFFLSFCLPFFLSLFLSLIFFFFLPSFLPFLFLSFFLLLFSSWANNGRERGERDNTHKTEEQVVLCGFSLRFFQDSWPCTRYQY